MKTTLRILAAVFGTALVLLAACGAYSQCPGGVCPARPQPQFSMPVARPATPQPTIAKLPQVARITAQEAPGRTCIGTAFLVYRQGDKAWLLTAAHNLRGTTGNPLIEFPDGQRFYAAVSEQKPVEDFAVVCIEDPKIEPLQVVDADPQAGELTTIHGYASGNYDAANGVFNRFVAPGQSQQNTWAELRCGAKQGMSGGPILDRHGRVLGIISGTDGRITCGPCLPRLKLALRWLFAPQTLRPAQPARPVAPGPDKQTGTPTLVPGFPVLPIPDTGGCDMAGQRLADIERRIAALEAKRDLGGIPGPMGPRGPQGIQGPPGEISQETFARLYAHIDAKLAELPPLRIQTLDEKGNVHQDAEARLGDLIKLRPVLVGSK